MATIDEQIQEIESSQGDLPSRIKKIELEKSELENNTKDLNDRISDLNKKQNSLNINKEICSHYYYYYCTSFRTYYFNINIPKYTKKIFDSSIVK